MIRVPEVTVGFDVTVQLWLRPVKDIGLVHVSVSMRSTIVLDCSPISQPACTGRALCHFDGVSHQFSPLTNSSSEKFIFGRKKKHVHNAP